MASSSAVLPTYARQDLVFERGECLQETVVVGALADEGFEERVLDRQSFLGGVDGDRLDRGLASFVLG